MISYRAECQAPDCTFSLTIWHGQADPYQVRADIVGKHRIQTGHRVHMWTQEGEHQ